MVRFNFFKDFLYRNKVVLVINSFRMRTASPLPNEYRIIIIIICLEIRHAVKT